MLTQRNYYLILCLIGCLTACDTTQYNLTPSVAGYPLRVGARWTYDRMVIIKKYESDSSSVVTDANTIHSEVNVWVEKDTVLDKKTVKVFKSREGDMEHPATWYVQNDKDGLKIMATQNPGLNVLAHQKLFFQLKTSAGSFNDSIIFEPTPILELKLPLQPDTRWTYKDSIATDSLLIEKAVAGNETLTLQGMKINCYKLEWIYSYHSLFKGYKITEWLSEKGLMKRNVFYDRITFTDENKKALYVGQYSETLTLKSFRYK